MKSLIIINHGRQKLIGTRQQESCWIVDISQEVLNQKQLELEKQHKFKIIDEKEHVENLLVYSLVEKINKIMKKETFVNRLVEVINEEISSWRNEVKQMNLMSSWCNILKIYPKETELEENFHETLTGLISNFFEEKEELLEVTKITSDNQMLVEKISQLAELTVTNVFRS